MSLLGSTVDNQGRTILRIVGDLYLLPIDQAGPNVGSFGVYVDTAEAVAAGATMEPRSDSAPWMLLRQFAMSLNAATSPNTFTHFSIDIRARRRLDAQSELMLILESGGMIGVMTINLQGRVLLAQP